MDKKQLSERDICTKYITPALERSGWDTLTQIREEFSLTDGRILVRGKLHARAKNKRAEYVLFYTIWYAAGNCADFWRYGSISGGDTGVEAIVI